MAPRLVLIADDDVDILSLVRVRLERSGYKVISARNGVEALQLVRDRHPDLAILDVPVILLTARARDVDVAAGAEAGADVYVTKPFSPQELESRVRAISHG